MRGTSVKIPSGNYKKTRQAKEDTKMNYAKTYKVLQAAITGDAKHLKIETDPGTVKYTLEEAKQLWDDLSPGESFQIKSIKF